MSLQPSAAALWLDMASLVRLCDSTTYSRALLLYRNQRVLDLSIEPVHDNWQLSGDVQGTQRYPYSVTVEIKRSSLGVVVEWDSDCTCPVGYQCKHGVALMIKAAYQGYHVLAMGGSPKADRSKTPPVTAAQRGDRAAIAAEIARLEAEAHVLRWLKDLEKINAENDQPASFAPAPEARSEQLLYLLSVTTAQSQSPQLTLSVALSYRKVAGGWAKTKPLKSYPEKGDAVFDMTSEADRDVLQLLRTLPRTGAYAAYYHGSSYSVVSAVVIDGKFGFITLEKAASTGRLYACDTNNQPTKSIQLTPPQTLVWEWREVTVPQSSEAHWTLHVKMQNSDTRLCLNTPPLYLDVKQGQCGLVDLQGLSMAQISALLRAPPMNALTLQNHQHDLIRMLGPVPLPPVLEQLPKLTGLTPKPCLLLRPFQATPAHSDGVIEAHLSFDYGGHRNWWTGQGSVVVLNLAEGRVMLQRDPEAELDAISRLLELGLQSLRSGVFGMPSDDLSQTWMQWAEDDYAPLREAGFELTVDDSLKGWIRHADAFSVSLEHQGDDEATSPWFDLSLGVEIEGVRHNILPWLPRLIAAAARHPRDAATGLPDLPPFLYLAAPEGGFVRLPTEGLKPWLGALLELVGDRDRDFSSDSLKLSRMDAMRTTAALGAGAVWEGAKHLREMVQRLSGRAELPDIPLPAGIHADLRHYQKQGVNWLQFLREFGLAGILADDMGLGKTLQTLAHIQIEKDAGRLDLPALIIAPVSLMGNWKREAERFCPDLQSLVLHGKDRHEMAENMTDNDIVIAPYSLLHRDRERWLKAKWHMVVLDEAQNIKNANTNAAQVVSELHSRHRLCLSGTPMENHLGEIWSLFHFLMPGFLGSQKRFGELFRGPIEKQGDPEALYQLRARVTPFMLRRTKNLVANELPPKVETIMRVELSGKQADLYETIRLGMEKTVREALNSKGLAKSQITILDALLKLRQVCCDPHLLKLEAARKVKESAKLEQLMEMLPEMLSEGRRVLLFSQFTSMLSLIEDELLKRKINWVKLTGQSQKRDEIITRFTSGEVPLFLISLKAGGVGLNLPQADTVIHYDPWWNPAVENQATDRAHRIGQTQSVWVVKLVAQGTIEERILALQERKAALAESMYSGSVGRKQPLFSESDLQELLKPLSR